MTTFHDFEMKTIEGTPKALKDFSGKVLLVVNVASKCGLTPQYTALEKLYKEHASKGFEVLGFPCNDFGAQEPGTEAEIQAFCSTKYDVTFPMFAKVAVLGANKSPLYAFLTGEKTAPDGPGDISWNFAKFLIGKDGKVLARFSPKTAPDDAAVQQAIANAIAS